MSINIRIVHPADPVAALASGIDTFIRGVLSHAPDDLQIDLVGISCSPEYPARRWYEVPLGRRRARFFPLLDVRQIKPRVPLSLRFTAHLMAMRGRLTRGVGLLDFHRPETALAFVGMHPRKSLFVHQNMTVIRNANADMRWKHMPGAYERLERFLVPQFSTVWCVREDAVRAYRERYPERAERFRFIPTWVDPANFRAPSPQQRAEDRRELAQRWSLDERARWLVSVGRLDAQKDPQLLLRAFAELQHAWPEPCCLLLAGDGVLRGECERLAAALGIAERVTFLGLKPTAEVARLLGASDLFLLASAFEGMPMAVLEALGCGLPVVCTDVGEVRRVVQPGVNGEICTERTPQALAAGTLRALGRPDYAGVPCTRAVADFSPQKVLQPVYERYRVLAAAA